MVLIVDDEPHAGYIRKIFFEQVGIDAVVATNLYEAIEHIGSNQQFDCVITDLVLDPMRPDEFGGLGVAKFVKMSKPGTPIVGYSAYDGPNRISEPELFDAFVAKGDSQGAQFEETIRKLIETNFDRSHDSESRNSAFLCHNSNDKPVVRRLAKNLKSRGVEVWFDEWDLVPGQPWQQALEDSIGEIGCAIILVGDAGIGPWADVELRAFLEEFVRRGISIIPVVLPNSKKIPELPIFLKQFTWVDLRKGLRKEGMERLMWGITGLKNHNA